MPSTNWLCRLRRGRKRTSGAGSVLLDVLALLDEFVGGAGEAALGGSAELSSSARGGAGNLSGGEHRDCGLFGVLV